MWQYVIFSAVWFFGAMYCLIVDHLANQHECSNENDTSNEIYEYDFVDLQSSINKPQNIQILIEPDVEQVYEMV